jgi:hypothetical protein
VTDADGIAVEVLPRLATIESKRWPVGVSPARDELLSSWLHRIACAHGLSPRHFGESLGFEQPTWSARLDNVAPGYLLNLLYSQTGLPVEHIEAMTIGFELWYPLALPMRWIAANRDRATWLQFCPSCLRDDEEPYFRRRWRRATFMICPTHHRALIDRCPSCRSGIASSDQRSVRPQHICAHCSFDLRDTKGPIPDSSLRRLCRLLDGLVVVECANGTLDRSTLTTRILALPALHRSPTETKFTSLSTKARLRCLAGLRVDMGKYLAPDPNPAIAAWRRKIIAAGGAFESLAPLVTRLGKALVGEEKARFKNRRGRDQRDLDLPALISAYRGVIARRDAKRS